jgi:hypothetical protein
MDSKIEIKKLKLKYRVYLFVALKYVPICRGISESTSNILPPVAPDSITAINRVRSSSTIL